MADTSASQHRAARRGRGAALSAWLARGAARLAPATHHPITGRDLGVGLIVALLLFAATLTVLWNQWAGDFSAYYYAGHFYAAGAFDQVYAGPPDVIGPELNPAWAAAVDADGALEEHTWPFIYLPWMAAAFAPIATHFEPLAAMNGFALLNLVLLLVSVVTAWRIMPTTMPLGRWMALSYLPLIIGAPFALGLSLGQLQILVFLACLLSIDRLQARRPVAAALWLALATMIKITPAAFAIIFLWNRQWKALAAFLATVALLAGLNVALIGWPLHAEYFALIEKLNSLVIISLGSVSTEGLLLQITDLLRGVPHFYADTEAAFPKPFWQELLVKGLFVAGLFAIWRRALRLAPGQRIAYQFFTLALLLPITVPLGWIHYFMLINLMLPYLLENRTRASTGFFIANLALFNIFSMIGLYYVSVWLGRSVMPQYFVYVPFFMALFVHITFYLRFPPPPPEAPATG